MKVVSVINQKGGVAKTTSTINIASLWAKMGHRVLVIDLDPQASASKAIFGDREFDKTVYDLLVNRDRAEETIVTSEIFNCDVIPGETLLSGVDIQLAAQYGREYILRRKLEPILERYDSILIDCSPTLGLLTINALMASDDIIIPICPEYFSLKGIELILDTLKNLHAGLGKKVGVRGVVVTKYRNRRVIKNVIKEVRETYDLKVFDTFIPDNIAVEEAHHRHLPLYMHAPRCKASSAYEKLSRELWV